jgi:hypothetical protein
MGGLLAVDELEESVRIMGRILARVKRSGEWFVKHPKYHRLSMPVLDIPCLRNLNIQ